MFLKFEILFILQFSRTYVHKEITKKKQPHTHPKTAPPEESLLLASGDSGHQNEKNLFPYVINYHYYVPTI